MLLTRDHLLAILSEPERALEEARGCGIEVEDLSRLLSGCFVRCKAAYYRPDAPFYTLKRISRIWKEPRESIPGMYWKMMLVDTSADHAHQEFAATLAYISNETGASPPISPHTSLWVLKEEFLARTATLKPSWCDAPTRAERVASARALVGGRVRGVSIVGSRDD